jgi:triphosphatase
VAGLAPLDSASQQGGPSPDTAQSAAEAFEELLQAGIDEFRSELRSMRADGDNEALHRAHITLRRVMTVFALFDIAVTTRRRPAWDRLRGDLKALANRFGEARRLDELLATYGDIEQVRARFAPLCDAARADALAAAAASAPLLRKLVAQAKSAAALDPFHARRPAAELVAPQLADWWQRLQGHGRDLFKLPAAGRHRVRLHVKRLRYASEFAAPLFPGARAARRFDRVAKTLADLQHNLGMLNDMAEAAVLLERPEVDDPVRRTKILRRAVRDFDEFKRCKVFWT